MFCAASAILTHTQNRCPPKTPGGLLGWTNHTRRVRAGVKPDGDRDVRLGRRTRTGAGAAPGGWSAFSGFLRIRERSCPRHTQYSRPSRSFMTLRLLHLSSFQGQSGRPPLPAPGSRTAGTVGGDGGTWGHRGHGPTFLRNGSKRNERRREVTPSDASVAVRATGRATPAEGSSDCEMGARVART